jgi:hypothetical protein
MQDFIASERQAQSGYFDIHHPDANGYKDSPHRHDPTNREINPAPSIGEHAWRPIARGAAESLSEHGFLLSERICSRARHDANSCADGGVAVAGKASSRRR